MSRKNRKFFARDDGRIASDDVGEEEAPQASANTPTFADWVVRQGMPKDTNSLKEYEKLYGPEKS